MMRNAVHPNKDGRNMEIAVLFLMTLLYRSALAKNECNLCACCKNGPSRCFYYENNVHNYCHDGCISEYYGDQCRHACPMNCLRCSNDSYCEKCKPGYFGHYRCLNKCPDNCLTCSTLNTCELCKPGYFGTYCSGRCRKNCLTCFDYHSCDTCKPGFYGKTCSSICLRNCFNCSTSSSCDSCKHGHYGSYCQRRCDEKCFTCSDSNSCTSCRPGNFGRSCSWKCLQNCLTCSNLNHCMSCKPGYFSQTCRQRCLDNCYKCSNQHSCDICVNGYYGERCTGKCQMNCLTCSNGSSCASCKSGKYGSSCNIPCPRGCANGTCTIFGYCDGCKTGFIDSNCGTCVDGKYGNYCDQDCNINCKTCLSDRYCPSCKTGYWGLTCQSACPSNCFNKSCDSNGLCLSCTKVFFGDKCEHECPENCIICSSRTNCTTCITGYKGQFCQHKCTNCKTGTPCGQLDGMCEECPAGLYGKHCKEHCPKSCKSCILTNGYLQCTACQYGKYGLSSLQPHLQCSLTCSPQCNNTTCDGITGYCDKGCMEGYWGKTCNKRCPENCKNKSCYANNGLCQHGCKEGLSGLKCSCPTNCNCNEDGNCFQCKDNFYNAVRNCTCTTDVCTNHLCTACSKPEFYAEHYTCCPCSRNCKNHTCDSASKCTYGCTFGYRGDQCSAKCRDIDVKCSECSSDYTKNTGQCIKCDSGFYTNSTSRLCLPCSNGCKGEICNEIDGTCIDGCKQGKWGESCDKECSPNCIKCSQRNGTCFVCSEGKYLSDCTQQCSDEGSKCNKVLELTDGSSKTGVTVGFIIGSTVLVLIIIGGVVSFYLFKKRNRDRKNNIIGSNESTCDNTAAVYSEIRASEIRASEIVIELADAVYAKPNKPKRRSLEKSPFKANTALEAVNASYQMDKTNNGKMKTAESPKYTNTINLPNTDNSPCGDMTKSEDEMNKSKIKLRKPPFTKKTSVYENSNDTEPIIMNLGATFRARQLAYSELETEEDSSTLIGHANNMVQLRDGSRTGEEQTDYAYYNLAEMKKRKVPLDKLSEYVSEKTTEDFDDEFNKLPAGLIKPYIESQKRENIKKNRYKGIYPYDQRRVILKGDDSDYINASYIDGYKKIKAYIASIGPTYKYMEDMSPFWRMVWQEEVGKIVMLTKLSEAGEPKCDQYWPDKDCSEMFSDIRVTTDREEIFSDYTVRSFTLEKNSEVRSIVHAHFTAWPDKGTPDDVTSLVEFRQKVNSLCTDLDGPIVVHCSAGIGRTGTYISIDSIAQEGEAEGGVDIYACVRNLREHRVNMVQTAGQYQYLHNAVLHTLTFGCKPVKVSKFHEYMSTHTTEQLGNQFLHLQASIEIRSDDETNAVKLNKRMTDKNRSDADIPGDICRPRLHLHRKRDMSGYINALYINSFRTKNRFLVSQSPLKNTVEDFLTLIVQENVSCIVTLEPSLNGNKTVGTYYPDDSQPLKVGSCTVQSEKADCTDQYIQRKLNLVYQGKSSTNEVTVTHIQFTKWIEKQKPPDDPKMFMRFVKDVELKCDGDDKERPVLVHCLTGAEKSGLFCVVSILLEKIQLEQEISVVNTVRQVKNRRHKSIPNKEQYIFCHQCLDEYLHTFDTYSNFCLER